MILSSHMTLTAWKSWEEELHYLPQITISHCYTSKEMDAPTTARDIHTFCDASEHAYGAVAYLRSEDNRGQVELSFILACSRISPKRQLSVPRLELCVALIGARLHDLIRNELTLPIRDIRHKPLPPHSRLLCLSPELCSNSGLIQVGGRLRQRHQLESESVHPIVLDPTHNVTKLIIQDYDEKLHHRTTLCPLTFLLLHWNRLLWTIQCQDWPSIWEEVGYNQMHHDTMCTSWPPQ